MEEIRNNFMFYLIAICFIHWTLFSSFHLLFLFCACVWYVCKHVCSSLCVCTRVHMPRKPEVTIFPDYSQPHSLGQDLSFEPELFHSASLAVSLSLSSAPTSVCWDYKWLSCPPAICMAPWDPNLSLHTFPTEQFPHPWTPEDSIHDTLHCSCAVPVQVEATVLLTHSLVLQSCIYPVNCCEKYYMKSIQKKQFYITRDSK